MIRILILLLLAAGGGACLGDCAWGMSLQAHAFAWPELGHAEFVALGALAGLALTLAQAAFWRLAFSISSLSGLRFGALGLLPGWAGGLWRLAVRMPVPPPHDLPARKIQIFMAALLLGGLALSTAAGLLALARGRFLERGAPRSLALRLFGLAWIFYLLSGAWTASWHLTGDGPHYLLMTHSLAYDQDLDLTNNYARADWRRFYDHGELLPQVPPEADGRNFSEHKPLLSLCLALPYRALGLCGAQWALAALAAASAALFFLVMAQLGYSRGQALLGFCLYAFSAPLWIHSQVFLLELSGATLFLCFIASRLGALPPLAADLVPALLIWLGLRFYVPSALLALSAAWARPQKKWLPLGLYALSLLGGLALNYSHFGALSPVASYDQRSLGFSAIYQPWMSYRYMTAILIDQQFGWLPFTPAFFLSFLGALIWWRRRRALFWLMVPLALSYYALIMGFTMWFGDMAPNRYSVPLMPIYALAAMEVWRSWKGKLAFFAAFSVNWAFGLGMAVLPWLCYSKYDGKNWILKILSGLLHRDLTLPFPSFMIDKPLSYLWVPPLLTWGYLLQRHYRRQES